MRSKLHAGARSADHKLARSVIQVVAGLVPRSLMLMLALGLAGCEREGALLTESQYQGALSGDWSGSVGDEQESISFREDGRFNCKALPTGFISTTLGQGVAGTISGTWTLQGNVINLAIDQTSNEEPLNLATRSTIVTFNQNQLVVKSDSGATSTFIRTD